MVQKRIVPHFRPKGRRILFRRSSLEKMDGEQEDALKNGEGKNERLQHLL